MPIRCMKYQIQIEKRKYLELCQSNSIKTEGKITHKMCKYFDFFQQRRHSEELYQILIQIVL